MTRHETEKQIGRDLELIGMIEVFGNRSSKARARKQKKICMAAISQMNTDDGLNLLSDAEILKELGLEVQNL